MGVKLFEINARHPRPNPPPKWGGDRCKSLNIDENNLIQNNL